MGVTLMTIRTNILVVLFGVRNSIEQSVDHPVRNLIVQDKICLMDHCDELPVLALCTPVDGLSPQPLFLDRWTLLSSETDSSLVVTEFG